jgi:hypothetical protein
VTLPLSTLGLSFLQFLMIEMGVNVNGKSNKHIQFVIVKFLKIYVHQVRELEPFLRLLQKISMCLIFLYVCMKTEWLEFF